MRRAIGSMVFGLILGVAAPAGAVDGVLEINQTCAENTGCFAGDTAGFPVSISQTGSYRLTGNLTLPSNSTVGIQVSGTLDASIDLNGFAITCPSCTTFGSGHGIFASNTGVVSVKNGIIRGVGGVGLYFDDFPGSASVARLQVDGVTVVGCMAEGMILGSRCAVTNSRVLGNGVGSPSGIHTTTGIRVRTGACRIEGNVVNDNVGAGISGGDLLVLDNIASGNGTHGLFCFSAGCVYDRNLFQNNNGGNANPQVNAGTQIGTNFCGGDLICP